jgi:hypothetical protein
MPDGQAYYCTLGQQIGRRSGHMASVPEAESIPICADLKCQVSQPFEQGRPETPPSFFA